MTRSVAATRTACALAVGLVAAAPASAPAQTLVTLARDRAPVAGEPPVRQPYFLEAPSNPRAVVALLPGGSGVLGLAQDGPTRAANNVLVRTRAQFARHGFVVALVDAASDLAPLGDGLHGIRLAAAHQSDIAAVIRDLRGRYPALPVWLIGSSRGAVAAAAAGAGRAGDGPDGLVLVSPVSRGSARDDDALDQVALERIRVPVLLVAHAGDRCVVSPPGAVGGLAQRIAHAQVRAFEGGENGPGVRACAARGPHGFLGLEDVLVDFISSWIQAH